MKIKPLTKAIFDQALVILSAQDPDLGRILKALGPPPMWKRKPGFAALVKIILEQQVSLASANATFKRLQTALPAFSPDAFLKLNEPALKKIGFSRQKTRYCRILAGAIVESSLDLKGLCVLDDRAARAELVKITGIGRWTADIYLLTALRRPDIWPLGDLALDMAVCRVKGLDAKPSSKEIAVLTKIWKPWRSVAARILWHYYRSRAS